MQTTPARSRRMDELPHLSRQRITLVIFIVTASLAGLLFLLDWDEMRDVLSRADWGSLPGALLWTAVSFICTSYAFTLIAQKLGIRMSRRDLTQIGFISITLNHVLTSGGVAGYSVRYLLMKEHDVSFKDILALSILHSYLTSLVMLLAVPYAFTYLIFNAPNLRGLATTIGVIALLLILVYFILTILLLTPSWREPALRFVQGMVQRVSRRDIGPVLERLDSALTQAVQILRESPLAFAAIMALIIGDWIASVVVLGYCFDALGRAIEVGELVTGFVIGILAGVLSMVPGGMGIQEGSMAGVFALMGVRFSHAALTAILFRVIFFFVPYLASLLLYWRLVPREERHKQAE